MTRPWPAKPLAIFSCCPTAPLKWSHATSANLMDCARAGIPVEYIAMPLSGFMAPVTLVGTLVQHTAETLSGIVLTQLVRPGAPALFGGSPAAFDVRYETTPMGAVETMMTDCAYSEIGKYLGLPTQAYIALSDAKLLDAQAGLETGVGATLAALSGINSVSGPGMLDFESCQSLEKLVLDNEICGMVRRMAAGIEAREDFPARPHFEELLRDKHLLIAKHTRKYLRKEHFFPGPVIDRAPPGPLARGGRDDAAGAGPPGGRAAPGRERAGPAGRGRPAGAARAHGRRGPPVRDGGAAIGTGMRTVKHFSPAEALYTAAEDRPEAYHGMVVERVRAGEVLSLPAAVWRQLGLGGREPDARTAAMGRAALAEYLELARPIGVQEEVGAEEFAGVFAGEGQNEPDAPLAGIFPRAARLALFAATLGPAVSRRIAELFAAQDFALGAVLDAVASVAADGHGDGAGAAVRRPPEAEENPAGRRRPCWRTAPATAAGTSAARSGSSRGCGPKRPASPCGPAA